LLFQAQDTLHANRKRPQECVDIPMDEAVGVALDLLRRIEIGAIDDYPQVFAIPDVDEGVINALFHPVIPEVLMVVDFQHSSVVEFL